MVITWMTVAEVQPKQCSTVVAASQTEPALSLAISSIQEFAKPISGINLRVPQQQGTAGSTGQFMCRQVSSWYV
eukprot:1161512-Pelagomonas_calceolata.AAC.22